MENQRTILIIALLVISAILYQKWVVYSAPQETLISQVVTTQSPQTQSAQGIPQNTATINEIADALPATPSNGNSTVELALETGAVAQAETVIKVSTDWVNAWINPMGGSIVRLELKKEPVSIEQADEGFPLLNTDAENTFIAQDGLLVNGQQAPNHIKTNYSYVKESYEVGQAGELVVPLTWTADNGVVYTKQFHFKNDSYVVDIDYLVNNQSSSTWEGYQYAQFMRTQPAKQGGGFGRLPSYVGGAIYTEEEKYQKIDFDDMEDENLAVTVDSGWVAMLQHYFVGAWIPVNDEQKQLYTSVGKGALPHYRIGYKTLSPVTIAPQQTGKISTSLFLGPKEQKELKKIEKQSDIKGLSLTVDYGILTFIADPLFTLLTWIHKVVGNWGWSIILLTLLIKLAFYPLSAASYKSMAGMKKLQPRIKTLKERYKDDRQKFQAEMMQLYKKEKINPAGGCLPILIQIPVFISLYWVLLESVEMRQAPFALWLQDLSAPDPFYVLPVLMGLSMFFQQKLNPAPMEDMQKKIMMIMPFGLTFLFLSFPQGLVLYWVVNNVLSIAQQWLINKKHGVA